eukprot:CAMPEP_0115110442 /NCGR_PEP_ID=MMETSP0227-20121206/39381_1 /TAXON_ID=89957 /ORGANISM="Polarella glacialis, Strain CCMP 1383" /LENGTH=79 /DNA_ID=CAMNT_0002509487 /DNA_START=130 /DNA_END=369 /DNA_ORIENTATION=+
MESMEKPKLSSTLAERQRHAGNFLGKSTRDIAYSEHLRALTTAAPTESSCREPEARLLLSLNLPRVFHEAACGNNMDPG